MRLLDNSKAILFLRGERPVLDDKYDILKHPNVALTTDGEGKPYVHGGTENAVLSLSSVSTKDAGKAPAVEESKTNYELLTNEELEELFKEEPL